jgi:DtxR family Mn-dependent transcriptional regulator
MEHFEDFWREFESNEISHSGAHYLLALASFEKEGVHPRAADMARQLGVSRAAVSLQLKNLISQRMVHIKKDGHVALTRVGADLVSRIANKRETVAIFLHKILGVSRRNAELDSCKVEHLLSEETGAALLKFIRKNINSKKRDPVA